MVSGREVRPEASVAGPLFAAVNFGKWSEFEKPARSMRKIAYGVSGREFGPGLASTARRKGEILVYLALALNYSFIFFVTEY